jgi:hypothetical protein
MAGSLTAQDRAEIQELFARYAWALDMGDTDGFVAVFTKDGVFDGTKYTQGEEALRVLGEEIKHGPRAIGLQHWSGNSVYEGDDSRVVVRSHCTAPRRLEGGVHTLVYVGYYIDECVKVDGKWLIKSRRYRPWEGDVLKGFDS